MKHTALAILLVLTAGLAGCASPEQLRAADEAACTSFGFQQGTPDFANCLQRESLARRYDPALYGGGFGPGFYGPRPFGWY